MVGNRATTPQGLPLPQPPRLLSVSSQASGQMGFLSVLRGAVPSSPVLRSIVPFAWSAASLLLANPGHPSGLALALIPQRATHPPPSPRVRREGEVQALCAPTPPVTVAIPLYRHPLESPPGLRLVSLTLNP